VEECTPLVVGSAGLLRNLKAATAKDGLEDGMVGRCSFTLSNSVLKAPRAMVAALETIMSQSAFNVWFQFQLAPLLRGGRLEHGGVAARHLRPPGRGLGFRG